MSEVRHTPGPWFVNETNTWGFIVDGPVGHGRICGPTGYGERGEANARLIAAAPCLLASLLEFVAALERGAKFGLNEEEVAMLIRGEAAIRKATGEVTT